MNRLALVVATGVVALSLIACGEQGSKTPVGTAPQNSVQSETPNINQPAGTTQVPNQ